MSSTPQGVTETTHVKDGQDVTVVNTTDHRSYPTPEGQEDKTTTEDVQVVHRSPVSHPNDNPATNSVADIMVSAASSVASGVRSAKDAITSSISPSTDDKTPKVEESSATK